MAGDVLQVLYAVAMTVAAGLFLAHHAPAMQDPRYASGLFPSVLVCIAAGHMASKLWFEVSGWPASRHPLASHISSSLIRPVVASAHAGPAPHPVPPRARHRPPRSPPVALHCSRILAGPHGHARDVPGEAAEACHQAGSVAQGAVSHRAHAWQRCGTRRWRRAPRWPPRWDDSCSSAAGLRPSAPWQHASSSPSSPWSSSPTRGLGGGLWPTWTPSARRSLRCWRSPPSR